jgi:acetylornithine deacetylase/succinyl-diaminopimelate desuccinylase-like protein
MHDLEEDGCLSHDRDRLLETSRKNEQEELECLRRIMRIPTCFYKQHDLNPMVALLSREFEARGYSVQVFPTVGAPIVVAELDRKRAKTLLFYNHYDVQPEEPISEWHSAPYELTLRHDRLYGRGVLDNKGPIVANLFGIQNALEAGYDLGCNVRFIIEGEEEAGSPHLVQFCQAHPRLLQADGCIWEWANAVPDQRTHVVAGVKGDAYFELRVRGFAKDAHSGDAPIVINPAWRLVWALSTLKNPQEEVLIDGFYDAVLPPSPDVSALLADYPPEQIDHYKQLYKTEEFLLGRLGVEFWTALQFGPTCSICGLSAGWEGPGSKTVIGKDAMAKVDFRLVPDQDAEEIHALLRRHLDKHGFADVAIQRLEGYGPSRTPITHPFIQLVARTAARFSGREPMLIPSSQGSGPAYLFGHHTPWAMGEFPDPEANIHAPNESMRLADFRYMTAFIGAVAIALGER